MIIVILDDDEIMLLRQRQQPDAPLRRHGDGGGELVVRRDINGADRLVAAGLLQLVEPHALLIQPDGDDLAPAAAKASRAGG